MSVQAMYDAYIACTLPLMIRFAKTTKVEIANTECVNEKLPQRLGGKDQPEDVSIGPRNGVFL
jgi:hypothetical protein